MSIQRHVVAKAAVIGDIHGRSDLLRALLGRLEPDRAVFVVGDLCDRGPDTRGVLDTLVARGARGVLGNHDQVFRHWVRGEGLDSDWLLPHMGGRATLASYGLDAALLDASSAAAVPAEHRGFLESLSIAIDLEVAGEAYWIVHAGLPVGRSLRGVAFDQIVPHFVRTCPHDLLWGAHEPEVSLPVGRPVIRGHVPVRKPILDDDVIAIDTGCGTIEGGRLTAVLLPEKRFVTV